LAVGCWVLALGRGALAPSATQTGLESEAGEAKRPNDQTSNRQRRRQRHVHVVRGASGLLVLYFRSFRRESSGPKAEAKSAESAEGKGRIARYLLKLKLCAPVTPASHTPTPGRPLNLKIANERAGERVRAVPFSFPIDSVLSSCRVVSSVSWERHLSHAHKQMDGGGGGGERVGAVSE
jgi:hypothetical protein